MSRGKIAFKQGPCGIISLKRYPVTHVCALAVSCAAVLSSHLVFGCVKSCCVIMPIVVILII